MMRAMNDTKDNQIRERVEAGRTLVAVAIGAAFAACVGISCSALEGELVNRAMFLLVASMPLLGIHFMVTTPGHQSSYKISVLMRTMTVLGILCLITGLAFLFEHAVKGAGVFFGALSVLCVYVCIQAQDRAISTKPAAPRTDESRQEA